MDEGALSVHQVKLVVKPESNQLKTHEAKQNLPCPSLGDGGGVGEHAHGALHLRQVAARDHSGWLVVDANLQGKARYS